MGDADEHQKPHPYRIKIEGLTDQHKDGHGDDVGVVFFDVLRGAVYIPILSR